MASICERSVGRRDMWWAKALVPAISYAIQRMEVFNGRHKQESATSPSLAHRANVEPLGNRRLLLLLTVSAAIVLRGRTEIGAVLALGCCEALLLAEAFDFLQDAHIEADRAENSKGNVVAVNELLSASNWSKSSSGTASLFIIRDVALASTMTLFLGALFLEDLTFYRLRYAPALATTNQQLLVVFGALVMVLVHVMFNVTLVTTIINQGQSPVAFSLLAAALLAQLSVNQDFPTVWFTFISASCIYALLSERAAVLYTPVSNDVRLLELKRTIVAIGSLSIAGFAIFSFWGSFIGSTYSTHSTQPMGPLGNPPSDVLRPLSIASTKAHPIDALVRESESAFTSLLQRQSKTLEDAVAEYRRRYQIPPPPQFDKWFTFAKEKRVQLIDEYDTIYHSLLPFWALKPETIRARVREALGFEGNNLIALLIRNGQAAHVHGGQEWQQEATIGMMKQFIEYLPDMDLAFNIHDEPRVVVPHDELSQLISRARDVNMPAAMASSELANKFSPRPKDVSSGRRVDEVKITRFNVFAHQPTWIPSRMSCSPDSPARALDDDAARDNLTSYALGDLGFIYNHTAFSDVCNSPSFATSHGFFDRPNAFNVVHDLFPIFSQSKMSSFQDILYPSPWYWYGKVAYVEEKEIDWTAKIDKLWWVGSTTGGFSRDGGWRRQHRQQVVHKLNALDTAKILVNKNADSRNKMSESAPDWQPTEVPRKDYRDIVDVHFSHVGQCDPGDCDAQREFFDIAPPADQQDAWKYKYLLDLDGNAFSGRFYAFLKSKSLVFKMAVFREWHEEWLKPWVHYIPLSLRGDESLESVRYFSREDEGKGQALRLADQGRQWAGKVLRNEDFEVWFFRLMLEYARVIDDNRENIGYSTP
ncbi:hypothetical protein AAFC00_004667 [Neodothiora populina]